MFSFFQGGVMMLWGSHQRRLLRYRVKPIGGQLAATLGFGDPIVALNFSQGELLSTKSMFWVEIFWLKRRVSQKWY